MNLNCQKNQTAYLFYRFHQNFVFREKSQLMFGLNRWKDIEPVDHKIYDAFIIDYSLSQGLIYSPLDKRSLVFGIGVQENLYCISSRKIFARYRRRGSNFSPLFGTGWRAWR